MSNTIYLGETTFINRTRMVEHLRKKGFLPFSTRPDIADVSTNVWLYETTDGLIDALNSYEIMRGHDRRFARKDK